MQEKELDREELLAKIDILQKKIKRIEAESARHKNMEEALRASDERFRLFFNTAPIGLSISDAQGKIINVNNTLRHFLGYSLEEFKKINYIELYADDADREHLLKQLYQSRQVRDFETKLKHKDGSVWTVLMNSDYIELEDSKVLLTSIYDITRLRQIQEELQNSEKRYELLFNNAPVGITVTDTQGNLYASNYAIQELLEYSAEELKNKNVVDFYFSNEERQRLLDLTQKNGIVRDFETKFRTKNRKAISVLINTELIDFKAQANVLLTSIRDISKLKQIEEELTQERDFNTAVLDTATSLIMVLGREGRVHKFNRACERTSGYSFREMKDKPIWEMISVDPNKTKEKVKNLFDGNYPSSHESIWLAKNGDRHLISWSNTVLLDNLGQVEYIIATGIDITESRQAELNVQEANQKLRAGIKELEERNAEMNLLSEMGEQLQICQNLEEACAISAQYLKMICPGSNGALYLISPSKDIAEAVEIWGETNALSTTVAPMNCWALRRGRMHLVDDEHPGIRCTHIKEEYPCAKYLCVPLMARGEALGIIHLNKEAKENSCEKLCDEHKSQLIAAVADRISLAVANLKLQETMRQQSIRDILTGLYNRRYLEESLSVALQRAQREQKPLGLLMFDIDHFKEFNDLFGHDGGDLLLRELGHLVIKKIRGGDIVSRFGGDEFVAMFPNASLEETAARAEELRRSVEELIVFYMGKAMGKCTISVGVAAYPENGQTADDLLKNADNALYRAKNEGRNKVIVASNII